MYGEVLKLWPERGNSRKWLSRNTKKVCVSLSTNRRTNYESISTFFTYFFYFSTLNYIDLYNETCFQQIFIEISSCWKNIKTSGETLRWAHRCCQPRFLLISPRIGSLVNPRTNLFWLPRHGSQRASMVSTQPFPPIVSCLDSLSIYMTIAYCFPVLLFTIQPCALPACSLACFSSILWQYRMT